MASKSKSKSTASAASSWWAERSKMLASLKLKPTRARPKTKRVAGKAKPKSIKAKKVVKVKKGTKVKRASKMKKAGKAKKGKGKRTK
jgi:hypothetical protein